jgi:uncharacterized protein YecT (DUF1311 family)
MTHRRFAVMAFALAAVASHALAGAMDECEGAGEPGDVAKCLTALDAETQAALKKAENAAGRAARDLEDATKHPGAYTAFASAQRAFVLYQHAQCEYVRAIRPDANVRPTSAAPTGAELAKIACRVDLARERIEALK